METPAPIPEEVPSPAENRKISAYHIIGTITVCLVALLCIAHCILIAVAPVKIVFTLVCILCCLLMPRSQKQSNALAGLLVLVLFGGLICFGFPPLTVRSGAVWKYPLQTAYLRLYGYSVPDWMPEFRADVQSDYTFDFMPSIMQGTGHISVEFRTSPARAEEIAAAFSPQAQYTVALKDYPRSYHCYLDEEEKQVLSLYLGKSWAQDTASEMTAQIYVLSTNGDWNHPHTAAVIADPATGRIQYTQLG